AFSPQTAEGAATALPVKLFTTCGQCDQECAVVATVRRGVLTKLDGLPGDQKSAGRLCPKGQAGIMELYNPYRLKKPLVRTNPVKGFDVDPGWKEVSWEEATTVVASKLAEILASDGPRAIAGDDFNYIGSFAKALGTPNTYRCGNTCFYGPYATQLAVTGGNFIHADLRPGVTKYVLALANTVGTVENPFGRQMAEAKAGGAKIVVLDPRLSEAAAKADLWAPIKPGTDQAALLAIINVIIAEDLYDHDYVAAKTVGLEELTAFIQPYTPEWAETITGIDAATLRGIGRDMGRLRQSVAIIRKGPSRSRKDSWRMVHAWAILNALVGAIDTPGGCIADRSAPLASVPAAKPAPAPYPQAIDARERLMPTPGGVYDANLSSFGTQDAFADSIVNGPYPIKFLLCAGANWLHSSPNTDLWVTLLQDRFLTVIDYQMTDTAWLADVVLPCPTYLEREELISAKNYAPLPQIQVRQPVVERLYDTRTEAEIYEMLAQPLGLADYLPPEGEPVFDARLEPLGLTFAQLKAKGLVILDQPFTPTTKFKTPSGKIELYSSVLAEAGFDPLPTWVGEPVTPTTEYPLYFVSFNSARTFMSEHAWNEWLNQPEDYGLWINATTAAAQGIQTGDSVTVTSPYGRLTAPARVTQGIRPDTVALLHGHGHRNFGSAPITRLGANDNDIARPATAQDHIAWYRAKDEPFANARYRDFTVKIQKA
ncbi:MAG: molybdopterin-dependent oxidoreductase, partial [Propionibacteriaceae bacterium]|nr:molybdopterin-dependent oxidoreductase [Propionibacteriaceae bacterium]